MPKAVRSETLVSLFVYSMATFSIKEELLDGGGDTASRLK